MPEVVGVVGDGVVEVVARLHSHSFVLVDHIHKEKALECTQGRQCMRPANNPGSSSASNHISPYIHQINHKNKLIGIKEHTIFLNQ